ncbi:hypothetical protein RR45_GL001817 [Lactococcus chungangensis CAU 28 = DSM 22330]|uniref:Uncharacterized protein n=1 Tax=Pseudolactococcus chungangensis CAU 28 = DSM 22330 TaxID=1122154 RepID=A0ABX4I7N6_9LACT|nr:hypothetical protein RR45_GL001817 [Lactococcus chungangensis CAU 28 = DSM 22330]
MVSPSTNTAGIAARASMDFPHDSQDLTQEIAQLSKNWLLKSL